MSAEDRRLPDIELGTGDSVIVKTPTAIVFISTFMGTTVTVYDNPDENPVGSILVRERR